MDEDVVARLRAEMDQQLAGLKEVAANLWGFYSEAVEQGFTPDQAMMLTLGLLSSWSHGSSDA